MRIHDTRHHVVATLREHLIAWAQWQFICSPREDPFYADQDVFHDACAPIELASKALHREFFFLYCGCESRTIAAMPFSAKLPRSFFGVSSCVMHPTKCRCAFLRKRNPVASIAQSDVRSVSKMHRRFHDRLPLDTYDSTIRFVISSCRRDLTLRNEISVCFRLNPKWRRKSTMLSTNISRRIEVKIQREYLTSLL